MDSILCSVYFSPKVNFSYFLYIFNFRGVVFFIYYIHIRNLYDGLLMPSLLSFKFKIMVSVLQMFILSHLVEDVDFMFKIISIKNMNTDVISKASFISSTLVLGEKAGSLSSFCKFVWYTI